jgi:hypothetical protein
METLAITLRADRLLNRVVSRVIIRQAEKLCALPKLSNVLREVRAMWDTGSTGCCIGKALARELGLTSVANMHLTSVHESKPADVYLLDIIMPDSVMSFRLPAAQMPIDFSREENVL